MFGGTSTPRLTTSSSAGLQAAWLYFVKFGNVEARTTAWKHMEDTAELHNITLRGAIKGAREVGLSTFLAMITKG